jgi:hypothetical protein
MDMFKKSIAASWPLLIGLVMSLATLATSEAVQPKIKGAWTELDDKSLPEDFRIQGEYVGQIAGGGKLGAQVISLGKSGFQAVLFPGGLPGDGWDGQNKILIDGKRDGATTAFKPPTGKRKYNAPKAEEFVATGKFPPQGHKDYSAAVADGVLRGQTDDGKTFELKKITRTSPTMGARPPQGALIFFNNTGTDEFKGGRWDKERGILYTDGKDIATKRKFTNFSAHLEFMTSYKPEARGQNRGNSGIYLLNHYEIQILDSFGLDGKNNECGGIYQKAAPKMNMCFPPLQWQTYDIDFTIAGVDEKGKKIKNARVTVRHNGVLIHENAEIPDKTGVNSRKEPEGTPGIILLQGHGNPTMFRNVWIQEKK